MIVGQTDDTQVGEAAPLLEALQFADELRGAEDIRDAILKGTDVDQPRNLAKSVTVE
jgi:hypothetical protein